MYLVQFSREFLLLKRSFIWNILILSCIKTDICESSVRDCQQSRGFLGSSFSALSCCSRSSSRCGSHFSSCESWWTCTRTSCLKWCERKENCLPFASDNSGGERGLNSPCFMSPQQWQSPQQGRNIWITSTGTNNSIYSRIEAVILKQIHTILQICRLYTSSL